MIRLRSFAIVFAPAYAILYTLAVFNNWALFTYAPATGEFGPLLTPATVGPSMYWYGWIATAALGGGALAGLCAFLPERVTQRLPACIAWAVPIAVILVFGYLLRGYFLR
jgi:hypothetical protein